MVRMLIKFNEEKILKDSKYTLEEINDLTSEILNKQNIVNKDEKGIWFGNGDDEDFSRFSVAISKLAKSEWCSEYIEAWIWDINGEIEDVMEEEYEKSTDINLMEQMEESSIVEEHIRTSFMFALNVKKIEKMGANWYNIVLDITEYLKSKGFEYSRTLGFINDRELNEEELKEIGFEIIKLGYGPKNFLYLNSRFLGDSWNMMPLRNNYEE